MERPAQGYLGSRLPTAISSEDSVTVSQISITDETLVDAYLSADQSFPAGNWTTVTLDSKVKDERGEFDTGTHRFTPDETGFYIIIAKLFLTSGSDQDRIYGRIQNVDDATEIFRSSVNRSGAGEISPSPCPGSES